MNAQWKAKWVAALRSGQYTQSQGALRKPDGYCCLGVLCDLYGPERWNSTFLGGYTYQASEATFPESGWLPVELRQELKLGPGQEVRLTHMNDAGDSFDTIANWIEEHL